MVFKRIIELENHYMVDDYIKSERDFVKKEKYMSYLDAEELEATRNLKRKRCACCEAIDYWKKINIDREKFEDKYYSKICIYTYYKDKTKMKNPKGIVKTKPYKLNYCPVCGKKLII